MSNAPLLELRSVSKSFGSTRALVDVSFELLPGEIHAVVGENGAGKTTGCVATFSTGRGKGGICIISCGGEDVELLGE
jgi:ABC-type sugar transport system ATPase subunit